MKATPTRKPLYARLGLPAPDPDNPARLELLKTERRSLRRALLLKRLKEIVAELEELDR